MKSTENDNNNHSVDSKLRRFSFTFRNERSNKDLWSVRLSVIGMIFIALIVLAMLFCVFYSFLRTSDAPEEIITEVEVAGPEQRAWLKASESLDSLMARVEVTDYYLQNVKAIINGKKPQDSLYAVPKLEIEINDSLLATSEAERDFIRHYEEQQKYNLSVLSDIVSEAMNFTPPVRNAEVIKGDSPTRPHFHLNTVDEGIDAIYRGTVIDSYYTTGDGYVVIISHPNDFVSRYSGMAETFVRPGDKVSAGSRIGRALRSGNSALNSGFSFELWQNGVSLNPLDFINFK